VFTSTDQQLIQKALKGNKKAWFSLLSRYEKSVFNYALRMTGNADDGKDLMQDIFISVFNSLPNFKGSGSFKGWLFRIAHFRCMDFYRRKRPDISLDDAPEVAEHAIDFTTGLSSEYATEHTPEQHAQVSQTQQDVQVMMKSLTFDQRVAIELKFFSQFTFEEIAEQLGISASTAKSRLYSALGRLKNVWEADNV
jgi:RNA polymerase sigma-70 factor (ECF subfamily)